MVLCSNCSKAIDAKTKKPTIKDQKGQEWVVEWWPMEGPLAFEYKASEMKKPLRRVGFIYKVTFHFCNVIFMISFIGGPALKIQ